MRRRDRRTNLIAPATLLLVIATAPAVASDAVPAPRISVATTGGDQAARDVAAGVRPVQYVSEPRRSSGLLGALGFGNSSSKSNSTRSTTRSEPSRSLLGSLFGSRRTSGGSPTAVRSAGPVPQPAADRESAWDGVPYHSADRARTASGDATAQNQPIRDPQDSDSGVRISRNSRSRSVTTTTSSRGLTDPVRYNPSRRSVSTGEPRDRSPEATADPLSVTSSSRRERSEQAIDSAWTRLSGRNASPSSASSYDKSVPDLVPRVRRRELAVPESTAKSGPESSRRRSGAAATDGGRAGTTANAAVKGKTASRPTEPAPANSATANSATANSAAATSAAASRRGLPARTVTDSSRGNTPSRDVAIATPGISPRPRATPARTSVGNIPPQALQLPHAIGSGIANRTEPSGATVAQRSPATAPRQSQRNNAMNRSDVRSKTGTVLGDNFRLAVPKQSAAASPTSTAATPAPGPSVASVTTMKTTGSTDASAGSARPVQGQDFRAAGNARVVPRQNPASPASDRIASRPSSRLRSPGTTTSSANAVVRRESLRKLMPGEASATTELPGIRVVTYGPKDVVIRQKHRFEILVENRGGINAEGLVIRMRVPDWAETVNEKPSAGSVDRGRIDAGLGDGGQQLLWKIPRLEAGKRERMFVDLRASKSGTQQLDVDWTLQPQQATARIHVQEPKLKLTIDGPEQVVYGESETYHVRVLNPGDGPAPNVVFTLSPNSKTPQSQSIGDIPAGKEAQFDIDLTAQDLGELRIHGVAKGDLELEAEALKTIAVSSADIKATLSGPELKYQNTEAIYTLSLENQGTAVSENVVATLELPVGVKYLGGIDGASLKQNRLVWNIESLSQGRTRDYECKFLMNATGTQGFAFRCQGSAAGQAVVALETDVQAIADLVLSVNDPPAPAPIGSDVVYEIVVRNRGSKAATGVEAIAQFSHGIEPQRLGGHTGNVTTGQVEFDPIPSIAAGEEVRLKVVAKADTGGHHRFRAEIRSDETVLFAEEATHYMRPRTERVSRSSSSGNSEESVR